MTRKEAIEWLEAIEEKYIHSGDESFDNKRRQAIHQAIEALEQPERMKGKWIDARDWCGEFLCGNCHETNINNSYKYCPNCGAKMGGEE